MARHTYAIVATVLNDAHPDSSVHRNIFVRMDKLSWYLRVNPKAFVIEEDLEYYEQETRYSFPPKKTISGDGWDSRFQKD